MRISHLSIRNFRSIQSLDMDLPNQCALVGPNNAGKSNILEALKRVLAGSYLSKSNFTNEDIYKFEADRDIEISCRLDPPVEYAKLKGANPVEIGVLHFKYTKYKVGEQKGQPRLEQSCLDPAGNDITIQKTWGKKGSQPSFERLISIPFDVREQVPLIYIGTNRSLKEQLPSARFSLLRRMFESVNQSLNDPKNTVSVTTDDGSVAEVKRLDHFHGLMQEALDLLRTDDFIRIETEIKQNALTQLGFDPATDTDKLDLFFTPLESMDFYKTLDIIMREDGFEISAQNMGEGMQNALVLAILQAFEATQKQGAILLIEEPEMFLHPQMQRSLARTLSNIAETNQVIYTTHSSHFVSIPEYDQVCLVRQAADGTHVTFSSLPTNEKRKEKLRKELDPERNELFFSRRLLLVEGDTEKLALPEYAKRLKIDLDRLGVSIVEVGGKRNLHEFADLASSFEIPVGILYDKDSSDIKDESEEKQFNEAMDSRERVDGTVRVWCFDKKYEHHLRKSLGDAEYLRLCEKHGGYSKAVRARLIAMEDHDPPPIVEEALRWASGVSIPETEGQVGHQEDIDW